MQKPTDAPEYISQAEWRALQTRMRIKRASIAVAAVGLGCVLGFFAIYGKRYALSRSQQALLDALDNASNCQVKTVVYSEQGKPLMTRDEIHNGSDWQINLWNGRVIFSHVNGTFTTYEPAEDIEFVQNSWYGSADYLKRIHYLLVAADPWKNGTRSFNELGQKGHLRRYVVRGADLRYLLDVDDRDRPVQITLERDGFNGWQRTEQSTVSYDTVPISDPKKRDTKVRDMTLADSTDAINSSQIAEIDLPDGALAIVKAVDAKPDGTVYFLVDGLTRDPEVTIRDSDGTPYGTIVQVVNPPNMDLAGAYYSVVGVPSDSRKPRWPLHISMILDPSKGERERYGCKIDQPTCQTLPEWLNYWEASDTPFFEDVEVADKLKGDYFSTLYRRQVEKGTPVVTWSPLDRSQGLRYELEAIDTYEASASPKVVEETSRFLGDAWFAVYRDLAAIEKQKSGRLKEDGKRALQMAEDQVQSGAYHGDNSQQIETAMDNEGLGYPVRL